MREDEQRDQRWKGGIFKQRDVDLFYFIRSSMEFKGDLMRTCKRRTHEKGCKQHTKLTWVEL